MGKSVISNVSPEELAAAERGAQLGSLLARLCLGGDPIEFDGTFCVVAPICKVYLPLPDGQSMRNYLDSVRFINGKMEIRREPLNQGVLNYVVESKEKNVERVVFNADGGNWILESRDPRIQTHHTGRFCLSTPIIRSGYAEGSEARFYAKVK